ncbi:hypothetical protein DYBT9275_00853 [Dyadobacter sp. CECT 9275]|uniref:Tetratricopeptide repeat protein n=1 Tax=Dyadobacter helix TaxID=2822344 RepID=A0A916J929_9BACT|nr:tetratricopeptide repeat protein [Dyadobacter sp. CECT 9275]CAG4991907.1 hypothetical protein DYBT9275_00853 [Dyadobacter sp. CECT 9275]
MKKAYREDYNQLVPILYPMDSVLSQSVKPQLLDAIKKASIVAEKHQNSKWLDNSYIILGKSRLYLGEWADGLEALRYVYANGKDESDKNDALILLMRAYIIKKDFSNALGVAEYLSGQAMKKASIKNFYLTKAYLHQQNGEYLTSVAILEETFPLLEKSPETARIHFAAAQMYDKMGQYALANKHYKSVSRNKPGYDLGFYSSMNSLQNRVFLNPKTDLSSIGFNKMLRDRKNEDLKDRIYFTMGLLAEHRKEIPKALDYLQKAVASGGKNQVQKAYTYLQLARINYESLERFDLSKAYYDSALTVLPSEVPEYRLVSDRKKALDAFVTQFNIVYAEDSLQKLAQLNPAALDNRIDQIIEEKERARIEQEKKAKADLAKAKNTGSPIALAPSGPIGIGNERRWELYDAALVNQGKIEFRRTWGNRVLEDNWRRSTKQAQVIAANNPVAVDSVAKSEPVEEVMTKGSPAWMALHETLKKNIPLTEAQLLDSRKRKEDALYNLGKIYRFDLKEPVPSVATFKRLLNEFPNTQYKDEIYYLLYLTLEDTSPDKLTWRSKLLNEFPNSTYARLVSDKAAESREAAGANNPLKAYEDAYMLYSKGEFNKALEDVEKNLPAYKGSIMEDKFALLRVFMIGKVRGKEAYTQAIGEFIRLYPNSIYLPRLKEMQELGTLSAGKR